jgi:hypothetical protein
MRECRRIKARHPRSRVAHPCGFCKGGLLVSTFPPPTSVQID